MTLLYSLMAICMFQKVVGCQSSLAQKAKCACPPPAPHSHQSLNVFKSWLKFCSLYNGYCNDFCQLQILYTEI